MVFVATRELFAAGVRAARFVGQLLAADHLVFNLDVGQLIFQLCGIRTLDHLRSRRQRDFKHKVVVQRLRVEKPRPVTISWSSLMWYLVP